MHCANRRWISNSMLRKGLCQSERYLHVIVNCDHGTFSKLRTPHDRGVVWGENKPPATCERRLVLLLPAANSSEQFPDGNVGASSIYSLAEGEINRRLHLNSITAARARRRNVRRLLRANNKARLLDQIQRPGE